MKIYDIVGKRKIYYGISLAIIALAVVFSLVFGVELDIQFKGGTIVTYSYQGELDKTAFEKTVEEAFGGNVSVQESTDVLTGKANVTVTMAEAKGVDAEVMTQLSDTLQQQFPDNQLETVSSNSVPPTIGNEFLTKCLIAVAFAAVLMVIYVAIRFRVVGGWSAGVTAVIALIHDVLVVFSTFIIFRLPIDGNFIAVVLTILGYSLNDTIVIFDRIRENKRLYGSKMEIRQLVNQSISQSLSRTIATSVTTIISMVVVCVVALALNVNSIITFAFPLSVGMLSGTYSSICLTGSLWTQWQEKKLAGKKN